GQPPLGGDGRRFHGRQAFQRQPPAATAVTIPTRRVHILCTRSPPPDGDTPAVINVDAQQTTPSIDVTPRATQAKVSGDVVFDVNDLAVLYGKAPAVKGVSLEIYRNAITALIGPSGCGKSTVLRCLNRMNDLIASARVEGQILY